MPRFYPGGMRAGGSTATRTEFFRRAGGLDPVAWSCILRSVKRPPRSERFDRQSKVPEWEIALAGDLTDKQNDLLDRLLDIPLRSRGTIYFDSCGGSAYVGISLAGLIRLRGLRARGVVLGECSSAALLPFAACDERFVTPHSYLFFHPVRWSSEENVKIEEAAEWTRHFGVLEDEMDRLLSRLFGMPLETILAWTRPGKFMSGAEIVAAGLARMVDLFSGDLRRQISCR
jgi:ATP-dependent Clp protease protease subunit